MFCCLGVLQTQKSSCSVSFTLQESFLLFPFQPEHLKLPISVGLVLVEFLGLDVAFEGTVKLQGVPVLLNVGQHAGNGGFLALKLRFAVP